MTKEFLAKLGIAITTDEISDEEGNKLIEAKFGELKTENATNKGLVDKYSSEIAGLKKEKQDRMTDEEKRQAETDALKQQIADANRKLAVNSRVADLVDLGYDKETATKYANDELDGKPTIEYQKQFKIKLEADIRAKVLNEGKDPKPNPADPNTKYTKENFKKGLISMEEMNALKTTNPTLYNELLGKPANS